MYQGDNTPVKKKLKDYFFFLMYYVINRLCFQTAVGSDGMKIQFNNRDPVYLQVVRYFKEEIARGNLEPGEEIPSLFMAN